MIKFLRISHRWLGIVLTLFLMFFATSGIVLNHRKGFSGVEVNRKLLPREHRYANWNNASIRGSLALGGDSVLVYGNLGIWLTTSEFHEFSDFNTGFPRGIDNRKVSAVVQMPDGDLYAGTYFGLFRYDASLAHWEQQELPVKKQRVSDLSRKGDSLLVLTRSELIIRDARGDFLAKQLLAPEGYDDKVGLFKTLWVVHSGEIYGLAGKIIVDAIGLIVVFLTITGLIFFINRYRIKGRKKKGTEVKKLARSGRWNLKWHNKIGWTTLLLLILTTTTGMFLRPPLLISIATKKVSKIPGTKLDSPNAWFDKLRAIRYDASIESFLVATSEGFYRVEKGLDTPLERLLIQPPLSVMGINVFEALGPGTWLVGSFSGLFVWQPDRGIVINRITGQPWESMGRPGPPLSADMITGTSRDYAGGRVWFDYNVGARMAEAGKRFPHMPPHLVNTPMSLWNVALEVHTGRIYKPLFGMFYILVVPLVGLLTIFMSIAGFVVWFKKHRKHQ